MNTIIPNELKITINTSVPGFQSIRYKPYMTLPNEKTDDSIHFNPLVKLKPSIIKSLPENVQKKEFFNRGLFQSLINSHGLVREKSLLEATKNGIVDNNIKVTLDTLFPSNSILYINKQPYVIADVQWTKGDWKIDKKIQQVPELESSRITDPYLYRTIVKDEIISGEKELQQLPKGIVYGSNYTGPSNVASGVAGPPTPPPPPPPPPTPPPTPPPPKPYRISPRPISPPIINKPIKPTPKYLPIAGPSLELQRKERELQIKERKISQEQEQLLKQQQSISRQLQQQQDELTQQKKRLLLEQEQQISKQRKQLLSEEQLLTQQLAQLHEKQKMYSNLYPLLPPANNSNILQIKDGKNKKDDTNLPQIENGDEDEDEEEIEELGPTHEIKLTSSKNSTQTLRNYFNNKDNFYFMVNTIFQNMSDAEKQFVNGLLKNSSGIDVKVTNTSNLSKNAYNQTVDNTRVNSNVGGGDCFFIAVADAINYHNFNSKNASNRIIYNKYGTRNMIYTQKMLRGIVSQYIETTPGKYDELVNAYNFLVEDLNEEFLNRYQSDEYKDFIRDNSISQNEAFFNLVNDIYASRDNFLIMKPTQITNETLKAPFSIVNKSQVRKYIESADYWANTVAIDAICETLGLNVITLEDKGVKFQIPYIYNHTKPWSTYMFLYHKNQHYELISFDYIFKTFKKEPKFSIKTNKERIVIFDKRHNNNVYPPFFMIFLIFATYYIKMKDANDRNNFQLLLPIMQRMYDIYNEIEIDKNTDSNKQFLRLFDEYFVSTTGPTLPTLNNNRTRKAVKNIKATPSKAVTRRATRLASKNANANSQENNNKGGAPPLPYQYNRQNYQYRPPFVSRYVKNNNILLDDVNARSNISYYITIDMELKKGTTLSPQELSNSKCNRRWNSIRKSYADLRGLKYSPTPDYNNLPSAVTAKTNATTTNSNSNSKSKTQRGGLHLDNSNNNKTRKHIYLS